MQRRTFISSSVATLAGLGTLAAPHRALAGDHGRSDRARNVGMSPVVQWNQALLAAIKATSMAPTIAARAISMVHEGIYNAWSTWDDQASFSIHGLRRLHADVDRRTLKTLAISQAAHDVLVDLFPSQRAGFDQLLTQSVPAQLAATVVGRAALDTGALAARVLLDWRHHDGSNQLGDQAPGAYADWTGYTPVNTPDKVVDPMQWEPLRVTNAAGVANVQRCLTPQWGQVKPFSLASGSVLRPAMEHLAPTMAEMQEIIQLSADLNDNTKAIAEYWAGGPGTVTPPGLWMQITELASAADRNTLDQDVKLFFAVAQSLLDASITAWDAKRAYQSCRPIGAIRRAFAGQTIRAWGGPNRGTQLIRGEDWLPYQSTTFVTPPFPEFVSGHSTFSAAAAATLEAMRGPRLAIQAQVVPGSSTVETSAPARTVTLRWNTVGEAADSAGMSRRYGGIHFEQGDLAGRALGRKVGRRVAQRCRMLFRDA